jgi:hypothetical protein
MGSWPSWPRAKMPVAMARARLRRQWSLAMDWATSILQRAHGFEGFADGGAVLVEGLALVGGEKADLAGEAVTMGVEAGAVLAFFGFGADGVLGVGQVGDYLIHRRHVCIYLQSAAHGAAPLTQL